MHHKTKSQGEDPRTFEGSVERRRVPEEAQGQAVEEKEEDKGEEVKNGVQKDLVEKIAKERIASFLTVKRIEEEKEKKGRKSDNSPRTRHVLVKFGRWLFLLMLLVTELAVCQRCSRDNGKVAATRSSSEREQMFGGDRTKVEAARRRRQD